MTTSVCQFSQKKLLSQAGTDTFGCTNRELGKHQPCTTVRLGKVKVRKGRRCQIATDAGVVRSPLAVVPSGDKRTQNRMANPGLRCARSLVEVTRILM